MAVLDILIPQLGEGLQEVIIREFLKYPGDTIARDEPIYVMETDKAIMDIESTYEGVLHEWLVKTGDTVLIGAPIARISVNTSQPLSANPDLSGEVPKLLTQEITDASSIANASEIVIPPRTRAYCRELGISEAQMRQIKAKTGKLMPLDVDNYLAEKAKVTEKIAAENVTGWQNEHSFYSQQRTYYGIAGCKVAFGKQKVQLPNSPDTTFFRNGAHSSLDLELEAARACIADCGIDAKDLDLIVCASGIPEYTSPGNAGILQGMLEATSAITLNIEAGCASFLYGVATAESLGSRFNADNVLLVVSHTFSSIIDADKRRYSDAAAAILLKKDHNRLVVRDVLLRTFGDYSRASVIRRKNEQPWYANTDVGFELTGYNDIDFHRFHVKSLPEVAREILEKNNLTIDKDIAAAFLHQSSITPQWFNMLNVEHKYTPYYYNEHGSCGCANIPLIISRDLEKQSLTAGDLVLCAAVGVGWHVGAMILEW